MGKKKKKRKERGKERKSIQSFNHSFDWVFVGPSGKGKKPFGFEFQKENAGEEGK